MKQKCSIVVWDYNIVTLKHCLLNDVFYKQHYTHNSPQRHIVWSEMDLLMFESGFKLKSFGAFSNDLVKSGYIP